jgi:hypothetical protein
VPTQNGQQIAARQEAILSAMESGFPLEAPAVQTIRENIAARVLAIRDIEAAAITSLKEAMA